MAWTAPITWSNGAVTAAQMNSLRDNLNYLKGFAALISNSTDSDTGTSTYLNIARTSAGQQVLQATVTGDASARFLVDSSGTISWGSGAAAADITMFRSAARLLRTDANFYPIGGLSLPVKSGAFTDADVVAPQTGTCGYDYTNKRLYIRTPTVNVWASVVLV